MGSSPFTISEDAQIVPNPHELGFDNVDELWHYEWQDWDYVFGGYVRGYGMVIKIGELWMQVEAESQDPDIVVLTDGLVVVFGYGNFELTRQIMRDMVARWKTAPGRSSVPSATPY